jgi:hypothetical protein
VVWLLVVAAAGLCVSLIWDFSWESTVGIDLVWAPAHTLTYFAVALAGLTSLGLVASTSRGTRSSGIRLGRWRAPFGVWVAAWGAFAFATAVLFDRWWQSAYGLSAGIWHPPQILKAVAFFALALGVWLFCLSRQNAEGVSGSFSSPATFAGAGGLLLTLITVVTLTTTYPNRQHSAWFYLLACGTYPVVLVAITTAGKLRFPATAAAVVYTALICLMVWVLPLFPARPQVGPIYNPLNHMMPPPFPLLLILPALALDTLKVLWPAGPVRPWLQALAAGLVFFIIFLGAQWVFAEFLLTDLADNWFFAGGGRHWPFFLKIDPLARETFWNIRGDDLTPTRTLGALGLSMLAARVGLWIGAWMKWLRR